MFYKIKPGKTKDFPLEEFLIEILTDKKVFLFFILNAKY